MEYGGITPLGLPAGWRVLVDAQVAELPLTVVGSGVRHSKLVVLSSSTALLGSCSGPSGQARG